MTINLFSYLKIIHKRALEEKKFSFENHDIFNSIYPFFKGFLYQKNSIRKINSDIRTAFEIKGNILFFSSARMSLYFLLSNIKIKEKKYVVVQSFTCGVVINSIIRAGYIPLYVDIDPGNLGTSFESFKVLYKNYSDSIRAVIVQHSFGIPALINKFVEFTRNKDIFLIEDCATTLGSKLNKTVCGNFGDASFWSFDSTKPLSIGTGGLLSIKNKNLYKCLNSKYNLLPTQSKKEFIFFSLCYFISQFCHKFIYSSYLRRFIIELLVAILSKLISFKGYHEDWNYSNKMPENYKYPSKLHPLFIYSIHKSLKSFNNIKNIRINSLKIIRKNKNLYKAFKNTNQKNCEIIPLRIFFIKRNNKFISNYVNQKKAWFIKPLQGIDDNSGDKIIRYNKGLAPISEKLNMQTYSIPINLKLIKKIKSIKGNG